MQKEIKHSWFFNHSPEKVWDHLTKSELLEQWLMKNDFKPIVGHKFRFTHVPKNNSKYSGTVNCEVLEVNPYSKLSYSWDGNMKDDSRSFNSIVIWTLIPKDNGTELQLQHNGFTILEDILNHTSGWNSCLQRFEELIKDTK
ncbi:hypothetical protein GALL_172720 [mine drainage metagenome]|uniref:Activator of Hsp90 ATPase homologue 1/2-like C-terminal domain-containing protein n=1 Tax=mine drainage metagenome TaxID=410659 RepID=A0A1J5RYI2_9ZZZZ